MDDNKSAPPAQMLSPEMIEKLRQTGIRIDREGRLWHEGEQISHPGLARALLRWLDRLDEGKDAGRPILRLDAHRYAYIDVDDAHLLVVSARWHDDRALVTLNDGCVQELEYHSLTMSNDNALYCTVRNGRLDARVSTPAYYVLAERITAADDDDAFVLHARGCEFPIGHRPGSPGAAPARS